MSFFILSDGITYKIFGTAQDHKRVQEGDKGKNTGGMGAYSPSRLINEELEKKILNNIIDPTLKALKDLGTNYKGFLYAGLMIIDNEPYLIEYNVRMGDPECQTLLPKLETDLTDIFLSCCDGKLNQIKLKWSNKKSLCIVLCSNGYPDDYKKNVEIKNLEKINLKTDDFIFHAGTEEKNNKVFLGGAASIAQNVRNICSNVHFLSEIGQNSISNNFVRSKLKDIHTKLIKDKNKLTIEKKRYIDEVSNSKLLGVYNVEDSENFYSNKKKINFFLNKNLKKFDLVIVSDYGHGLLDSLSAKILIKNSKFLFRGVVDLFLTLWFLIPSAPQDVSGLNLCAAASSSSAAARSSTGSLTGSSRPTGSSTGSLIGDFHKGIIWNPWTFKYFSEFWEYFRDLGSDFVFFGPGEVGNV